ncbi:MAG: hypothetical protein NVS2B12_11780 [Ktedonobacteraceae bacterium]
MSTNPNPGQQPDASNSYGGYSGYRPARPADDPYGAAAGPTPDPQGGAAGTGPAQNDPNYVYGQQGQQYSYGQQQQYYGQPGQQSRAYVPPSSVSGRNSYNQSGQSATSATDEASRKRAFYSYLGLCFTGIVFFFLQRRNSYVRFHAAQSVVAFTPIVAVYIVLRILTVLPLVGVVLGPILGCLTSILLIGGTLLWVFLMVQSYRGSNVRLPIIAEYADAFVARFSRGRTI